jgi:hypothetical protein
MKSALGHVTLNFCFLYPVGSPSHAMHFGASEDRIVVTLFFKLRWDRYRFDKKAVQDTLCQSCVFASGGIYG